jgi:hypothetical protein
MLANLFEIGAVVLGPPWFRFQQVIANEVPET